MMTKLPVLLAALATFGACATVAPFQGPPDLTPAQLMVAKPCTHLPALRNVNMNLGGADSGWSVGKVPPSMVQADCGDKYWPSIYCKDPAKCKGATYGTLTNPGMSSADQVWVIDVLSGAVDAAAQLSNRFYVGSGDAKMAPCKAMAGMPVRCSYKVQVVGEPQPQSATELVFSATEPNTVIGLIGITVPPVQ